MEEKMMKEAANKDCSCSCGKCGEGACTDVGCGESEECGKRCGGMCEGGCGCKCVCHKIKGMFVIVAGLVTLAGAMNWIDWNAVVVILSSIVILGGVKKLFAGNCKCC